MSDTAFAKIDMTEVYEKPVQEQEEIKFPPFPDPKDDDFEEDIPEDERSHYRILYKDLNLITTKRLHCTACDRHLGCSARNENRMRIHPMLRTLVCQTCHTFYNSGEFEKGDDGSELYCRWCGQGGQVYCCSDCPHVFCAKCVKRNFGQPKIKEIEELDDWRCFKCNNKSIWDLRALCWAVLRYCDLKNKITYVTNDPVLKEAYQKSCAQDFSECCKSKIRKKERQEPKKRESDLSVKKSPANIVYKLPPTIQVKKFASINVEDSPKSEKKAQKRPASPKNKILIRSPITVATKVINNIQPMSKKIRLPTSPVIPPVRFGNDKKIQQTYSNFTRIRPKPPQIPMIFNGFSNVPTFNNDNINLSIESLTQGLDMSAMAAMASTSQDDDVVCTPDFPLEPLCEVTEDPVDDDVQCITPGPVAAPMVPPPLLVRPTGLTDMHSENIIQMTENDVTVNASTGGLKFRVDPQTLSSNKMYRLPDGRIFAINANPAMPGGYSATIVAVTDANSTKVPPKGTTFAAKLSAVSARDTTPPPLKQLSRNQSRRGSLKSGSVKSVRVNRGTETSTGRMCDLNVPVEWYRYNLVDAIDALEYSLSRLHQLKKDATTMHLRTRSIPEMRLLHRSLDRALSTSMTRFREIKENLNKEFKQYVSKKSGSGNNSDDDDVEILPEEDNDDPIYIDENSMESNHNEGQDVDLTIVGSSDFNDSSEKSFEKNGSSRIEADALTNDQEISQKNKNNENNEVLNVGDKDVSAQDEEHLDEGCTSQRNGEDKDVTNEHSEENGENQEETHKEDETENMSTSHVNGETEKSNVNNSEVNDKLDEENILNENSDSERKVQDAEMSEEMIENLLKDDNASNSEGTQKVHSDDVSDEIQDPLVSDKVE